MFLEERYEKIIRSIEEKGRVTVKELSLEFKLTEDCIRKDLRELESRGNLKRVYGGAIIPKDNNMTNSSEGNITDFSVERNIALNSVSLIKEGDIIFLDASIPSLEIAKILSQKDIRLTIVSNMLEVILELKKNPFIQSICIGGEFNKEIGGIIGAGANRYIREFTFDKAFIGACGVNMDTGNISTLDLENGNTKKTIIESSHNIYIIIENEKFNHDEFFKFASVKEISSIITDIDIINSTL